MCKSSSFCPPAVNTCGLIAEMPWACAAFAIQQTQIPPMKRCNARVYTTTWMARLERVFTIVPKMDQRSHLIHFVETVSTNWGLWGFGCNEACQFNVQVPTADLKHISGSIHLGPSVFAPCLRWLIFHLSAHSRCLWVMFQGWVFTFSFPFRKPWQKLWLSMDWKTLFQVKFVCYLWNSMMV